MLNQCKATRRYLAPLMVWGLILAVSPARSEPSPTPVPGSIAPSKAGNDDTQQRLTELKTRQTALTAQRASLTDRLSAAKADSRNETAQSLQTSLAAIEQLGVIYEQQATVLDRLQTQSIKLQHFQEQQAKLKQQPSTTKQHFSFMELDHAREELNAESHRERTLSSKIERADAILQQAEKLVAQQQEAVNKLEADIGRSEPVSENSKTALETAHWELELAEQTLALNRVELRGEKKAQAIHQVRLNFLQAQAEFLQRHAQFDSDELHEQLRRIDKEAFELNRLIARAKEQQLGVKSHLEQARKKFAGASPDQQNRTELAIDALQLEFEALKTQIDGATRRLELLDDWKQVWRRRYALFNQTVEQAMLPQWQEDAKLHLDQIDNEENDLKLWLDDWQSRQITLANKLGDGQPETRLLVQQREDVGQIIASLQGEQTALENSRRLQQKLIDEIDILSSQRSWRDWIDLTLHYQIYQNTLLDWCYALASALTTFLLLYFLRWILLRKLKHLEEASKASLVNGFLDSIKRANSFFFLMLAVSIASLFLTLTPDTKATISSLTKVVVVFQAAVWGSGFVRVWVFRILARRTKRDGASMGALSIFNFSSQVILWSVALLLILQNLGIDVTALVAGLGIGGVAVALSLQRILGDLFSSLSIVLDKPFVVGDFVIFDDFLGSVEHIGIKTTRIRSLTGEQIICANGDLLNTRIRNFKRMHERRVAFKIGVVYQTPADKLRQIPGMIRGIIEAQQPIRFDRAHFSGYGDFSLLFEIVYYVLDPDYNLYMDIQQTINLEIFQHFQAAGIEFAYPTQSLYLQNLERHER